MKRFLFLFVIFYLLAVCLPFEKKSAFADSESSSVYAVADGENVWFYKDADETSGLFILPYTYYVLVLSAGQTFSYVQYLDDVSPYQSVTGYCKTDELTFVDFVPQRPFLKLIVTATYTLSPSPALGSGVFNTVEKNFVYYGSCYFGTACYFYVSASGEFDYIPSTGEISYDLNTDYLAQTTAGEADSDNVETDKEEISALQIFMVCLCAAAVIAIAALVVRGKKTVTPRGEEF